MNNPYISLLKIAWQNAFGQKWKLIIIYVLFLLTNLISALSPLLLGWVINKIQMDSNQILKWGIMYAVAYFLLKLAERSLHGPARVMEQRLSFDISRNLLENLNRKALSLPLKWHQNNHFRFYYKLEPRPNEGRE